jgi:hypothetical protein
MRRVGGSFGGNVVISVIATVLLLVAIMGAQRPVRLQNSGTPPWAVPRSVATGVQLAGLSLDAAPGVVTRYAVHLDVLVNGKPVPVPAGIGIDRGAREIAPLYTDDGSGVIHIDSDSAAPKFTLGEFFDEWQVPLANATAFVNGSLRDGDLAGIVLTPHQEIAVAFGSPGTGIPDKYAFPGGV